MNVRAMAGELVGEWTGTNQLWLSPDEPVRRSATMASFELVAGGRFGEIRYTWEEGGRPHAGVLLFRLASEPGPMARPPEAEVDVVWTDSWHMGSSFLLCRGETDDEGRISGLGSYPAPEGPDWGWRIVIAAESPAALTVLMYNIMPDGQVFPAVEAAYTRAAG